MDPAWILHLDLDQFIAAVEIRRRPELAGRPVVVGGSGDPTERSVVATASYEARARGVRSGTPMKWAVRKIPDAVFLPNDKPTYEAASEEVMTTAARHPGVDRVEVIGWDEAFVAVRAGDPEALAQDIRARVRDATDLSCGIGIGDNTLRAKIATGFAKETSETGDADPDAAAGWEPAPLPGRVRRGVFRLTADNWFTVMGDRPTTALWGIGTRTAARFTALGLHTVAELAAADPRDLAAALGPTLGPAYVGMGRGLGRTELRAGAYVPKSRSREITYQQNLLDRDQVAAGLGELAFQVITDLEQEGRAAFRIGVKVRFAPFWTRVSAVKLAGPTVDPAVVADTALLLYDRLAAAETGPDGGMRPVRLLGVRAEMVDPPPA